MAATAARQGGAGQGRSPHEPKTLAVTATARIASLLLPVLSAAIIVCAAAALVVVGLDDRRLSSERHAALRLAIDEVHAVFGEGDRFGDGKLRLIERPAGLKDLRFATDPPTTADREAQSLHDRDGRIVGWFSWAPDRALARIMNKLWVLAGLAGAALAGCAFVATHAGHRLGRLLARSIETVRRLTDEDALTAVPNHAPRRRAGGPSRPDGRSCIDRSRRVPRDQRGARAGGRRRRARPNHLAPESGRAG